jgi:hypothetical protein
MLKWRFRRGGTANRARSRRVSQAGQSIAHDDFSKKARQDAGLFLEAGGRGRNQLK